MENQLSQLLTLLQNPQSPNFSSALHQLQTLNLQTTLSTLSANQRTSLLAQLETTIQTLTTQKQATSSQLQNLRRSTQAIKSYQQY